MTIFLHMERIIDVRNWLHTSHLQQFCHMDIILVQDATERLIAGKESTSNLEASEKYVQQQQHEWCVQR